MPVVFGVGWDFTAEQPVDDSEVHQSKANADGPPSEAHPKGVRARDSTSDGEVVALCSNCGEKYRK